MMHALVVHSESFLTWSHDFATQGYDLVDMKGSKLSPPALSAAAECVPECFEKVGKVAPQLRPSHKRGTPTLLPRGWLGRRASWTDRCLKLDAGHTRHARAILGSRRRKNYRNWKSSIILISKRLFAPVLVNFATEKGSGSRVCYAGGSSRGESFPFFAFPP